MGLVGPRAAVCVDPLVRSHRAPPAVPCAPRVPVEKGTIELDESKTDIDVDLASAALARAFIGVPLDSPVATDEVLDQFGARSSTRRGRVNR